MQTKKWFRSRMLWSNLIGLAVILVSTLAANEDAAQEILTAEASILVVINLILRLLTHQGLEK